MCTCFDNLFYTCLVKTFDYQNLNCNLFWKLGLFYLLIKINVEAICDENDIDELNLEIQVSQGDSSIQNTISQLQIS